MGVRDTLRGLRVFIGQFHRLIAMAKSDSFFIRARVDTNGASFVETEIDLGSYVNLGVKSSTLLRIHNLSVQYADNSGGPESPIYSIVVPGAKIHWQLTTQTQSASVYANDKSVVSTGGLLAYGDSTATAHPQGIFHDIDVGPQAWSNGYLIGVDSLYLGTDTVGTMASGEVAISIVLECTLETATQASATALALSQQ